MSKAARPHLAPEESLVIERGADMKSEYRDGWSFATPGENATHSELLVNLCAELGAQSRDERRRIYSSDLRLATPGERNFVYPDVSGLGVEPTFRDETRDVLLNPSFVVEVLSPSTEADDRGRKLAIYLAVPSTVEIVLSDFFDGVDLAPLPPFRERS